MINLLAIRITDRIKESKLTQETLSRHGSIITTRLGFHEVSNDMCSREGYILLHLDASEHEISVLCKELESPGGIILKRIVFEDHETDSTDVVSGEGSADILIVVVEKDNNAGTRVQNILTSFGCNIRTRLGIKENINGKPAGLIILELKGDNLQRELLAHELKSAGKVHLHAVKL